MQFFPIFPSLPVENLPCANDACRGGKSLYLIGMTFKRITCDPKRMNGQPCVRQLRLTVRRVVEAVATYPDRRDLQREFPELEAEDIREALAYAAANLDDKVIELATAG